MAQDVQVRNADLIHKYELMVSDSRGKTDGPTWWKLAELYQNATRYGEAERAYRKAIPLLKAQQPGTVADALDSLGTLYVEEGKLGKAEKAEHGALELREARNDLHGVGVSWMHLAMVSLGQHHLVDALMFAELAAHRLAPAGEDERKGDLALSEEKLTALLYLANVLMARGEYGESLPVLSRARAIATGNYSPTSLLVAYVDFLTGRAHWKSGDLELAAEQMQRGTHGMERELGWGHPTYITAMKDYEACLKQLNRMAEAAEVQRAIERTRGIQTSFAERKSDALAILP